MSRRSLVKRSDFGGDAEEAGMLRGLTTVNYWAGDQGGFVYWHVDNVAATLEKLLPITPREEEFVTAAVMDPFGNVPGISTTRTTWKFWDLREDDSYRETSCR